VNSAVSERPPERLVDSRCVVAKGVLETDFSFTEAEKAIDSAQMLKLGENRW
jgi:hypothetical protein